ncbi:MAG TPA: hypothetical protein PK040_05000 [Anaerolineaceae bacterium]|nr:hypothetical protein [Anaerolineaceae bacterium]
MKLTPPKFITWLIALALLVLALIGVLTGNGFLAKYDFWFAFASAALLILATMVKGL